MAWKGSGQDIFAESGIGVGVFGPAIDFQKEIARPTGGQGR